MPLRGHITARVMLDLKNKHTSLLKWVTSGLGRALICLIQHHHVIESICVIPGEIVRGQGRAVQASVFFLCWILENLNLIKSEAFFKCLQILPQISNTLNKVLSNLCHHALHLLLCFTTLQGCASMWLRQGSQQS